MVAKPIAVFLADDHAIVRQGLRELIGTCPDLVVVGSASTAAETLARLPGATPDVLVLDVGLPDIDGVALLRSMPSGLPVVILTARASADLARRALDAGATGFVLKSNPFEELEFAIRAAARREIFVSPSVARALLRPDPHSGALTSREREVAALVGRGLAAKAIAARLSISVRTVESHKRNAMRKLGVSNSAALAREAVLDQLSGE